MALRQAYHWIFKNAFLPTLGLVERTGVTTRTLQPLPPPRLRYKIQGVSGARAFGKGGTICRDDIEVALGRVGIRLGDLHNVLDFGCGCGRTLIPLSRSFPDMRLFGTDIDEEAVAWCGRELKGLSVSVNGPAPPLAYPDSAFDLVYAISVFTHLDEQLQYEWLDELSRVTKPGGYLLATIHGPSSWSSVPTGQRESLKKKGFLFFKTDIMKGFLPDWYQAAYHSEEYVRQNWTRRFQVVCYQPKGMMNYHDVVILQRERG